MFLDFCDEFRYFITSREIDWDDLRSALKVCGLVS